MKNIRLAHRKMKTTTVALKHYYSLIFFIQIDVLLLENDLKLYLPIVFQFIFIPEWEFRFKVYNHSIHCQLCFSGTSLVNDVL